MAWGELGALTLEHNDGFQSDTLPYIGTIDQVLEQQDALKPVPEGAEFQVDIDEYVVVDPDVSEPCRETFTKWVEDFMPEEYSDPSI